MTRTRYAIAVVMVATLGVGVVWLYFIRDDGSGSSASGPTGVTAPSSTAGEVVPTGNEPPPRLENDSEDWDRVVRSIVAYEQWLFTHPDPDLLIKTEVPSYELFADGQLGLRNLATKGWRYDPPRQPLPVELVRFHQRPAENVVVLFVRFGRTPPTRVVDRDGKVIQDTAGSPPGAALWTLVREPPTDKHWRLFKVSPYNNAPPS